jgi:Amiloride-sensitive sodium channel
LEWLKNQSAVFDNKYSPEFIGMFNRFSYGMTFNMAPSDQLFNDEVSEEFFGKDKFHLRGIDNKSDLIKVYQSDYPLKSKFGGLKLSFAPKYSPDAWENHTCQPMKFLVHSPYEIPGGYSKKSYCLFGHSSDIEVLVTPEIITTDESLRSYPPERRNCYFEDERPLRYFKKYTKKNCESECYTYFTLFLERTKCVYFFQIRNETERVCDMRYYFYMKYFERQYLSWMQYCGCLDECNIVRYNFEIISSNVHVRNEEK